MESSGFFLASNSSEGEGFLAGGSSFLLELSLLLSPVIHCLARITRLRGDSSGGVLWFWAIQMPTDSYPRLWLMRRYRRLIMIDDEREEEEVEQISNFS
ncbi:hypothetical protein TYRP_012633 [Tyrophagus putrescentiae]|nr:hypothetical protein TYRP_012633 [Tyrophagus putrescentiae]